MDTHEWACRIKSARRKKRLVKTDRDKQLIKLDKRIKQIDEQLRSMPIVAIDKPYQRGWKRTFVLTGDMKQSPKAEFYEVLLNKINTVSYHHDKSFKRKKRRKCRYVFKEMEQLLQDFAPYEWNANKANLTDEEKLCFTRVETIDANSRNIKVNYVFSEPWRYALKVIPHIVTHVKLMDADLKSESSVIANHIKNYDLWPRINLLIRGKSYSWHYRYYEREKYINQLKNMPRYCSKEAYLDL